MTFSLAQVEQTIWFAQKSSIDNKFHEQGFKILLRYYSVTSTLHKIFLTTSRFLLEMWLRGRYLFAHFLGLPKNSPLLGPNMSVCVMAHCSRTGYLSFELLASSQQGTVLAVQIFTSGTFVKYSQSLYPRPLETTCHSPHFSVAV